MRYRVVLKVSYHEAWFEFDNPGDACKLAETLLTSMVDSADQKKKASIHLVVINPEITEEDDD